MVEVRWIEHVQEIHVIELYWFDHQDEDERDDPPLVKSLMENVPLCMDTTSLSIVWFAYGIPPRECSLLSFLGFEDKVYYHVEIFFPWEILHTVMALITLVQEAQRGRIKLTTNLESLKQEKPNGRIKHMELDLEDGLGIHTFFWRRSNFKRRCKALLIIPHGTAWSILSSHYPSIFTCIEWSEL